MDVSAVGPTRKDGPHNNEQDFPADNHPNHEDEVPSRSTADDVENQPPNPPLDMISASSNETSNHLIDHEDPDPLTMEVDIALEESNDQHMAPSSRFVPGPLREEPTLKEKLVDRERQRRKEAERARLKRQFALTSNGGGLVYDSVGAIGGASITGTVGEESTHADMEDSISGLVHSHSHHHQGGDTSSQQLGYTMERFLQETATSSVAAAAAAAVSNNNNNLSRSGGAYAVASAIASSNDPSNVIREEAIEGDPATAGAPDKGVVMERFLNDPVVVDPAPPPPAPVSLRENSNPETSGRSEDVHRSVSFDMDLPTNSHNDRRPTVDANDPSDDHLHHLSMDDSNASVQVEVAPEDDMMEPVSPGDQFFLSSEVAPSSLETDEHHHRRQNSEMETSLGSVGPSMDRQSLSSNVNNGNDDDNGTDGGPRVLRLTEAEIQEMAAIEEASIGNAPPSDRDAESLVGDLVGTFGTPNVGEGGMNFGQDQDTTTTAMESGSILSGRPLSAPRSTATQGEQPPSMRGEDMDDMDHNSIDDMGSSASVSSHLVVSPGASVSGSGVSVTANPPSEIIERGDNTAILEDGDNGNNPVPPPPSSFLVDSESEMQLLASPSGSTVDAEENRNRNRRLVAQSLDVVADDSPTRDSSGLVLAESRSSVAIREELRASDGPPAEEIVNRRLRPGMVETSASIPQPTFCSHVASRPENRVNIVDTPKSVRTVDEFDFDKNDLPMTPRSLMSDSLRDLPGDDQIWSSPGSKMNVSPLLHRGGSAGGKLSGREVDQALSVPPMTHDEVVERPVSGSSTKVLESTFRDIRINNSSTVEAKQVELYCRRSIQSKAMETRLLPLVLTLLIEIPVLKMISQDSRISSAIGQQHYQLLLGFIPLIAAISGNASAQASSLTTAAICNGLVTSRSYWKWLQEESKVTAIVGMGVGAAVGLLAFTFTSGNTTENLAFAAALSIAQCVCLTLSAWMGPTFPLLMSSLFGNNSRMMSGLVARAVVDVIAVSLTCAMAYGTLMLFVSQVDAVDATTDAA